MSIDAYTLHLLGLAYEECKRRDLSLWMTPYGAYALDIQGDTRAAGQGGEALTALLTDLGVEVPERPSAERVAEITDNLSATSAWALSDLRHLYAREPLTVLALLEGGAS